MATIESYLLSDGKTKRYRVRYRTPERRQTDKRGFRSKREAEQFAASVEVSKLRGEFIAPADARVTIGALGPGWLARQTHLKPSAFRPVEIAWRVHVSPRWSDVSVSDVRHTDVQQWVSELATGGPDAKAKGSTTVIRAFGVLAAILDDAVRDRRTLSNPARGVNLPRKVKREHNYLSHNQVAQLADAAGGNGPMVLLLAYCGLRWGEAAGLRVRDCDLLRRRVTIVQNAVEVGTRVIVGTPKSHKRRTVPVPAFVVERLAVQCEGKGRDDLLFPGPAGFMRPPRGRGGWFANAVARASAPTVESYLLADDETKRYLVRYRTPEHPETEIDKRGFSTKADAEQFAAIVEVSKLPRLTPHDLRHTAASLAVSAGANVKAVQKMLGHASAAMTLDVYADLFDDDLDAVAVALDHAASEASVGRMWARGAGA